jgi:two-component system OmpR family sensor kinase
VTEPRRAPWDFRDSARLRIAVWMLWLCAMGLLAAGTAVLVVESNRIEDRADRNIAQEFEELDRLLASRTVAGQPAFASPEDLLESALAQNVAQRYEVYLGLVDNEVRFVSEGPGTQARADLATDAALLDAVLGSEDGFHTVETGGGEVRFGKKAISQGTRTGSYVVAYFTDPFRGEFVSVLRSYLLVAALTLLVVCGGAWLVAGRILRPVHELEVTARDITQTDLDRRLDVSGSGTDLSRLAATFNAMLDRLSAAFRTQRQFLDDAGHELGTPITILQGHLELLDPNDAREVEETRALLLDELQRMARLVGDLVLLAKAERPDFVRPTSFEVRSLTEEVLELARALGDRRWALDEAASAVVWADRQKVVQALLQLAANAVRYSAAGDEVAVGSAVGDGEVLLWVRDTGVGIAEADAEAVFERFARTDPGRGDGTGLGLAIVKAIAEAHDGRVTLSSRLGEGSTFTLHLPLSSTSDQPSGTTAPAGPSTDTVRSPTSGSS